MNGLLLRTEDSLFELDTDLEIAVIFGVVSVPESNLPLSKDAVTQFALAHKRQKCLYYVRVIFIF